MQDENFKEIQDLIALKRYEQPEDAYFEEFLDEFHRRQRQDLLQRSARSLFFERVATWFSGSNKMRLVYGGGLAYAVCLLTFFLWPKSDDQTMPIQTVPTKHIEEKEEEDPEKKDMLSPDKDKAPVREAY